MARFQRPKTLTINHCGARAGTILCGIGQNNQGIRLRVLQEQPRGKDGAIGGTFVILDAGNNMHSPVLANLLHRDTDAQEVLLLIREHHASCVNVANTNLLIAEETKPAEPTSTIAGERH